VNSALPPSLTRFGVELERAIRRELDAAAVTSAPPTRRRRRLAMRSGLFLVTSAAAVLAIVSSLAPPALAPAWAKQVMARAAAVLAPSPSPRLILHIAVTATETAANGTTATWSQQSWEQQGPPWNGRRIVERTGQPVLEQVNSAGQTIYDRSRNESYTPQLPPISRPHYTLRPGPAPGSYRLRVATRHGFDTVRITAEQAKALRNRTDVVAWIVAWNGHVNRTAPLVFPRQNLSQGSVPNPWSLTFAKQLRTLLSSGAARVTRATTADGKPAIEIDWARGRTIYYVSPATYSPLELDTRPYDSQNDVRTRARFTAYQTLPLAGHSRLLHFAIPRTARVDRAPADFWRAFGEFVPPY